MYIDTVAATFNFLPFISAIKLNSSKVAVNSDHVSFLFDVNLHLYFDVGFQKQKKLKHLKLNPSRGTHRDLFAFTVNELLAALKLKELLKELDEAFIPEVMEFLDGEIIWILAAAVRVAEGPNRNTPFSERKLLAFLAKLYWIKYRVYLTGGRVKMETLEKYAELGMVVVLSSEMSSVERKEHA